MTGMWDDLVAAGAAGAGVTFTDDRYYSWTEVAERAEGVAVELQHLDVPTGTRSGLIAGTGIDFLAGFLGSLRAGVWPLPINPDLKGPLLAAVLEDLDPAVVLHGRDVTPQSHLRNIHLEITEPQTVRGLVGRSSARPDDVAFLLATSGTTGRSKQVLYTERAAYRWVDATVGSLEVEPDDVLYSAAPLFHGAALLCFFLTALATRSSLVLAPRFSVSRYWADIREYGVTKTHFVGTMGALLLAAPPDPRDRDHPALKRILRSGVDAAATRTFEHRFAVRTTEMYGMTDLGLITSLRPPEVVIGSCGRALPWLDCVLVDPSGREVGSGEVGQLLVRPHERGDLPVGYLPDRPLPEHPVRAGWFVTGDVLVDPGDGNLQFVAREKDVIRRSGENIAPADIEAVALNFPGVTDVSAYAVPAEHGEDEVMLSVVVDPDLAPNIGEFHTYLDEQLPYFAVPRYVRRVDELPKTPSMKIATKDLRLVGVTPDTLDFGSMGKKAREARKRRARYGHHQQGE